MSLGQHVLIELWECNSRITSVDAVREALLEAVQAIGATLVHSHVHAYSPQGVTAVAILAESHLAIHSWPEHGYLAADVFTCGETTVPDRAVNVLNEHFEPGQFEVRIQPRGVLDETGRSAAFRASGEAATRPVATGSTLSAALKDAGKTRQ